MKTVTRKEIFEQYPITGAVISDFQNLLYDEDYPEYNVDFDHLSLGRNDSLYDKTLIFMLSHQNINTYTDVLSKKLKTLFNGLEADHFVLMSVSHLNISGSNKIRVPEFKKARNYLQQITETSTYKEALSFPVSDLPKMVDVYFWLGRFDGNLPEYIFFFDSKQRFFFFICKRGNIHLTVLDKNLQLSKEIIKQNGFVPDADIDQF